MFSLHHYSGMGITQKYNYESTMSVTVLIPLSELGHCENFLFLLHFFCSHIYRQCTWVSLSYEQYIIHSAHTLCLGNFTCRFNFMVSAVIVRTVRTDRQDRIISVRLALKSTVKYKARQFSKSSATNTRSHIVACKVFMFDCLVILVQKRQVTFPN